ncbi:iron ABC transporter permease [Breoghania sp. L-A4]|uniref:ABC transporter permease n=1 Tax=Breoghania sp. L-A4 TaxID=2304600 RepID=UPI000E35C86A|nr:iron ABC transporter permease [Breoghania sp. L-A4]AXS39363.1 iron ABC transporter permease [Breoghania sp. L-A4]
MTLATASPDNDTKTGVPCAKGRGEFGWLIAVGAVTALVLAPIITLVILAMRPAGDIWPHLISTVLPRSIATTALLMLGVGTMTSIIGVGTAWLVTMCRFPGRRLFDWALLVPLSVPTYIIAYAYVEILDYTGPVQTALRTLFGYHTSRDYWFPEIRSLGGAAIVMGLVLYPYVYLTTRATFMMQSSCILDVSRTLGAGPLRLFFRVALPLARPAVAVGVSLALMECLNDIGAVEFFGVQTLTFSVYDTWLNRGSLPGAAQMACAMLVVVFALLWAERYARRHQRFHLTSSRYRPLPGYRLSPPLAALAVIACALPVLLGFVFPALLLADFASRRLGQLVDPDFLSAITNSLLLAAIAAIATVAVGVTLAYAQRIRPTPLLQGAARLASIGYAVPGTILAVGILIPLAAFDNMVDGLSRQAFGIATGLMLTGSGAALVYAYVTRFLAVSYGSIESGFGKISPHLDMVARTLGRTPLRTLTEVNLPIIKPVMLSAALLVFVDCMKELPATILLRPFNFETLSTTVYTAASQEVFEDAALPALAIVLVGLIPVILLASTSASTYRTKPSSRGGN